MTDRVVSAVIIPIHRLYGKFAGENLRIVKEPDGQPRGIPEKRRTKNEMNGLRITEKAPKTISSIRITGAKR